ncbi:hypothetical protein P7D37_01145 [Enterococcus hirae]|nr:hypothetical protein [Enterococcus hirae]
MIAIFVYNILLIILYSITMTFAIYAYLKEKNNLFLWISLYLAFFIFDNTIIYMTEFLNSFAQSYVQAFMSAPAVKTIIFMGNAFFPFLFLPNYKKKNFPLSIMLYCLLWLHG